MSNEELVQLIQEGNTNYLEDLYMQNKNFIYSIVKKYSFITGVKNSHNQTAITESEDLMQEAYFGLYKAVMKYDSDQGTTFLTYAGSWIQQAIRRYIENCGNIVRVSVHMQAKIYRYNKTTSLYLQKYNREPTRDEYKACLEIGDKELDNLEKFMSRGQIRSLDELVPGVEDDNIKLIDTLASDVDIENDITEKVSQEQLQAELWDLLSQVLDDDRKVQIIKLRYIDKLALENIAKRFSISRSAVEQMIIRCNRLIKRNADIRRLAIETGLWDANKPFSAERVKAWCEWNRYDYLDKKELKYARRMGWVDEELLNKCGG